MDTLESVKTMEPILGEELFRLACSYVYARNYAFQEADREDAIQTLCLVGLECAANRNGEENVRAYQCESMKGALKNFRRNLFYRNRLETLIFDAPVQGEDADGEPATVGEQIADSAVDPLLSRDALAAVHAAIDALPENERIVATACLIEGHTLDAAGKTLNVCRERARQILDSAREKLQIALVEYTDCAVA